MCNEVNLVIVAMPWQRTWPAFLVASFSVQLQQEVVESLGVKLQQKQ